MPTATTLPLILLILLLWRYTQGQILSIVLFTSVFDAASALNLGGLGVAPWLFTLGLCLCFEALRGHAPFRFTSGANRLSVHLLLLFIGYAVLTGIFFPFLFAGAPVINIKGPVAGPLAWSVSNLAQLCYLLAAVLVYFLTVSRSRRVLRQAMTWYVYGCTTSALFALYQLANALVHVPYPEAILYSNPSHVIYHAYRINGMWRLNSTFSEASAMASYMTVAIALEGYTLATQAFNRWRLARLALMVTALLLTISSVGYACLIFMMGAGALLYVLHVLRRGAMSAVTVMLLIGTTFLGTTTYVLDGNLRETIGKVMRSTLLEKSNTQSYKDRAMTSAASITTLKATYLMGAGWGSVRASGLVYTLLGNVGVIGTGIFAMMLGSLFLPLLPGPDKKVKAGGTAIYEPVLFATTVTVLGLCIAGAEPVEPVLWALLGMATLGYEPRLHRADARFQISRFEHSSQHAGRYRDCAGLEVPPAAPRLVDSPLGLFAARSDHAAQ